MGYSTTPIGQDTKYYPEETPEAKAAKNNENLWGSGTISLKSDPNNNNQLYWHSSLVNNDFHSAEDALAAEKAFREGTYNNADRNPNVPDTSDTYTAPEVSTDLPDSAKELMNTPPPPSAPKTVATRAGFTNELPFSSVTTQRATVAPRAVAPLPGFSGAPVAPDRLAASAGPAGQPSGTPQQPAAPTVDRAKIDAILNPLGNYQNAIADLAQDNTGESAAEAMLKKADALARQRASDELLRSSQGAMGAARSARNRGDRALLERQAIGEQAYLGSQAQREDVLRQAELEGNLAGLRATELEHDRQFKLDALSKAAELGLNRGALEVDIGKADLASSTQLMNNTFQEMLANKQIDEAQYEALLVHNDRQMQNILAYTQAMAALQFQYDQLGVQDQQVADQLLMNKYGIDQETMVALKKIKEDGKFQWDQVLSGVAGGVGSGLTGGLFSILGVGGKKGG